MARPKERGFTIQSIERAAAVMRTFTESEPELGVTELSSRVGLHKSTVSRILSTLQAEGFVSQNPVNGKYRLGVGLISLAGVALGRVDVRSAAYTHIERLVEQVQESASVSILAGRECVNVLNKASPKPVRYVNWIGRRLPLHCTASGKVLLAWLESDERRAHLALPLRRYTDHTVLTLDELTEQLATVAAQGFALVEEEFEEGYNAVAAPVRDHEGRVVAAIAVSGPAFRLAHGTLREFVDPLCEIAADISAEMGYSRDGFGPGSRGEHGPGTA